MKKTLAILLALAMSCTMLASCGEDDSSSKKDSSSSKADTSSSVADDASKDEESKEDSSETESVEDSSEADSSKADDSVVDPSTIKEENETKIESDKRLLGDLVTALSSSKTLTLDLAMSQSGMTVAVYMTTDGTSTYTSMNLMGIAMDTLENADGNYTFDNANKKYYLEPADPDDLPDDGDIVDEMFNIDDDMTYVSTATVTIDGTEYVKEVYKDKEDGTETAFFFLGSDLKLMSAEGAYISVNSFSATADKSKLSVPSDYTAMTDAEFEAFGAALLGM